MGLLKAATFTVADPGQAAARLGRWLDYDCVERGVVSEALARLWDAPAVAGRAYAVCRPASGAPVFIRFVEGGSPKPWRAFTTLGWSAAELCVQDVLAVNQRLIASPFEIIGPPETVAGLPTIHPMQVRGPDDEVLYLTQILTRAPGSGLPQARTMIDRPFILVLACRDLTQTAQWFAEQLRLDIGRPLSIDYRLINQAFDLPEGTLQTLATARSDGEVCLEFDQYPPAATPRPCASGALPPGLAMATLLRADFDALPGTWISPPVRPGGAVYGQGRAGLLLTPDGARVEVVEGG